MPWQMIVMLVILSGLLIFGLVGYWRGKGISSCCSPSSNRDRATSPKGQ